MLRRLLSTPSSHTGKRTRYLIQANGPARARERRLGEETHAAGLRKLTDLLGENKEKVVTLLFSATSMSIAV